MNDERNIFIGLLFLSGQTAYIQDLRTILAPINMENRIMDYMDDFNKLDIGLHIRSVAGGYQMVVDDKYYSRLSSFFSIRSEILSKAAKETLAVIAYKQPISKVIVEQIRGVNSAGVIKNLLDKNLIKIVGRKNVPGRPLIYATTDFFLEYFGLNNLSELPTFREWQELNLNPSD